MARSKRRTVKVVLVATLLAAAGAGTYYFTSGGGSWTAWRFAHSELVAEDAPTTPRVELTRSELDAVASAWGGASPAKSSPVVAPQVDPVDERYQSEAPAETGSDDARFRATDVMPVMLPAVPAEEVTRGQEPDDYRQSPDDEKTSPAADDDADDDAEATVDSSRRARAAFGEELAAAPSPSPSKQSPASDRYEAPSSSAQESVNTTTATASTNPFAAPAEPVPMAAPRDEPVEYHPDDFRTASAAYRTVPDGGPTSIQDESSATSADGAGRPGERALEGPQKPALVIQKFAPPEIQVGKAAKFAVQVRNVGGQTAENVIIRDEVPHGTRVVNSTPRATADGNFLVWDLGALSTGEQRTVEIELMPTEEGEIGSVATVSYSTQASAKTRCTMPQLAVRMTAPSQVMVGQEQRVKIELRNPGTGDATGVMLLENVPDNVKHAAGPALEFEIGTLRAGETRELELVLTAHKAGLVVNALTARADGNLQVQQQVEFEVIAPALQLSVEGPERRYLERPATYQVIIENPGTAPAHDIELVTKLPKGMQFVQANNMGEYDAATHSVYWSLAQLPEGEKGSVELVAMPVEPGQQTFEIEGKAQQGLTDEVKQDVLVEGLAAIMFEVRDLEDPIEVGGETTYEIRVLNQGSKAATNVQVLVTLPPGIEALSASGETSHTVQGGGVVFEPLAQLAVVHRHEATALGVDGRLRHVRR